MDPTKDVLPPNRKADPTLDSLMEVIGATAAPAGRLVDLETFAGRRPHEGHVELTVSLLRAAVKYHPQVSLSFRNVPLVKERFLYRLLERFFREFNREQREKVEFYGLSAEDAELIDRIVEHLREQRAAA